MATEALARIEGIELSDWVKHIVSTRADFIKQQIVFKFDNGYGASVVRGPYTYGGDEGLFELGVLKFDGNRSGLVYDTPITNDVLGWLTGDQVLDRLNQIKAL